MNRDRVLVVGLAPGSHAVGREPWIHTDSGRRLAELVGVPQGELLTWVDGDNLVLGEPVPPARGSYEAERGGRRVLRSNSNLVVVAAGWTVGDALGCGIRDYFFLHRCGLRDGTVRFVGVVPHPSGASTYWNDWQRRDRAKMWLSTVVHDPRRAVEGAEGRFG